MKGNYQTTRRSVFTAFQMWCVSRFVCESGILGWNGFFVICFGLVSEYRGRRRVWTNRVADVRHCVGVLGIQGWIVNAKRRVGY